MELPLDMVSIYRPLAAGLHASLNATRNSGIWKKLVYTVSDVDECLYHRCEVNAICSNTLSWFSCYCKPGYSWDGFNCTPGIGGVTKHIDA